MFTFKWILVNVMFSLMKRFHWIWYAYVIFRNSFVLFHCKISFIPEFVWFCRRKTLLLGFSKLFQKTKFRSFSLAQTNRLIRVKNERETFFEISNVTYVNAGQQFMTDRSYEKTQPLKTLLTSKIIPNIFHRGNSCVYMWRRKKRKYVSTNKL